MRLKNNKILRDFYRIYQVYSSKNKIQLFEKNIILIGTPTHGNLGDQAISVAEIKFLKEKFPTYNIIEIFDKDVYSSLKFLKRQLKIKQLVNSLKKSDKENDKENDKQSLVIIQLAIKKSIQLK